MQDKNDKDRFRAAFDTQDGERCPPRSSGGGGGCDALSSVQLLVTALRSERLDVKQQVVRLVMQGGEGVCVHASVVGGILGLILGYTNLPQDWLVQLPQENIKFMNAKLNLLLDLFGLP